MIGSPVISRLDGFHSLLLMSILVEHHGVAWVEELAVGGNLVGRAACAAGWGCW